MDFKEWSLEKRFAYLSFIVIFILGFLLSTVTIWFNRNEMVRATAYYVEHWFYSVVDGQLTPDDFNTPMDTNRIKELDRFMHNFVLDSTIRKIKIWNSEGRIIYSDDKSLINHQPPVEHDLEEALSGRKYFELTNPSEEYYQDYQEDTKIIEVYVPVKDNSSGKVIGAYEFYVYDPVLTANLLYHNKLTWIAVSVSLGILFLALQKVVKHASKTIESQDSEIELLSEKLGNSLTWQEKSHLGTIKALMAALDAKDDYTAGHCLRVKDYAEAIGKEMNLTEENLKILGEACLFHDIGKIGVPEAILNKPARLTDEEYEIIKSHASIGADIVGSIHYFSEHAELIRYHHERVDCKGYPEGLCYQKVPFAAKILAVADTYDALTSDRPYRKGIDAPGAIKVLREVQGTQLDSTVVEVFIKILEQDSNRQVRSRKFNQQTAVVDM